MCKNNNCDEKDLTEIVNSDFESNSHKKWFLISQQKKTKYQKWTFPVAHVDVLWSYMNVYDAGKLP